MKSKQVIVMRKTFIVDGKKVTPRKGKFIAQGAHASMKAILDLMSIGTSLSHYKQVTLSRSFHADSAIVDWLKGLFTKVCCAVETEDEVVALYEAAKAKGIPCSLITDAGLTEFNGVQTITCCAIGPAWDHEIDEITGKLELF